MWDVPLAIGCGLQHVASISPLKYGSEQLLTTPLDGSVQPVELLLQTKSPKAAPLCQWHCTLGLQTGFLHGVWLGMGLKGQGGPGVYRPAGLSSNPSAVTENWWSQPGQVTVSSGAY
jgi:hypothetical protein